MTGTVAAVSTFCLLRLAYTLGRLWSSRTYTPILTLPGDSIDFSVLPTVYGFQTFLGGFVILTDFYGLF